MSTVSLGGITVGYDDVGGGDPVVLVHGHPFDRSMWRPQVEHLGRTGWRVIAPDLRGYGESTVVPGATTLDVFAEDIVRLISRRVPGATLEVIDGAAHLPNLERPAEFNAVLQRFLQALPATVGR